MRPCAEWLAMTARQKDGEHESAGLLNDFVLTKTSALPCKVAHDLVHTLERTGGCPARASVDSSLLLRSDGGRLRRTDRLCDDQRIVGFVGRLVRNNFKLIQTVWWMVQLKRRIDHDPNRLGYQDQALTPVQDDEDDSLDLLTKTDGAKAAVAHQRKVERLTHLVPAE